MSREMIPRDDPKRWFSLEKLRKSQDLHRITSFEPKIFRIWRKIELIRPPRTRYIGEYSHIRVKTVPDRPESPESYLRSSLVILTDSWSPLINLTPSMPRNKFHERSTVFNDAFSAIVRPKRSPFVNLFPLSKISQYPDGHPRSGRLRTAQFGRPAELEDFDVSP